MFANLMQEQPIVAARSQIAWTVFDVLESRQLLSGTP